MTGKKMSFDDLANKAEQLGKEEQLKVVGGRRNRGGVSSWSWGRGGIIDDDHIIRYTSSVTTKSK